MLIKEKSLCNHCLYAYQGQPGVVNDVSQTDTRSLKIQEVKTALCSRHRISFKECTYYLYYCEFSFHFTGHANIYSHSVRVSPYLHP